MSVKVVRTQPAVQPIEEISVGVINRLRLWPYGAALRGEIHSYGQVVSFPVHFTAADALAFGEALIEWANSVEG